MSKKRRRRTPFTDEIREAVDACGINQNQLSIRLGIDRSTLSRFMRGERGLSFSMLDRLADELDLHVVSHRKDK